MLNGSFEVSYIFSAWGSLVGIFLLLILSAFFSGSETALTASSRAKLRSMTDKLLIMKLSPNVTSVEKIALAAEKGGADAVSAVNTFVGMAIDHKTGKILLSTKFGGLSGPAIKPMALAKIHKIYNQIKIPIIGMRGIASCEDIIEFIRAGSSLVQIGTLNYNFERGKK